MSTHISDKVNQCYSISATRFCGGKDGVMAHITISDSETYTSIALKKRDVIDFCADIIKSMNELE